MSFWNNFMGWFWDVWPGSGSGEEGGTADSWNAGAHADPVCTINPGSGLPMVDGCSGLDIQGNPYGVDLHHQFHDGHCTSAPSWDDPFQAGSTDWDNATGKSPWDD